MKRWKQHIVAFVLAMVSFQAMAFDECVTFFDNVYFYDSWSQIFELNPADTVKRPIITNESPYETTFAIKDEKQKLVYIKDHLAASLNDSIWVINSKYLQREFKGDAKMLKNFVPLYFNEKLAYVIYSYPWEAEYKVFYFYIDFEKRRVSKVTPKVLKELLAFYPDLLKRYESMRDYKSPIMIEDYFIEYVKRVTNDETRPYILDLVEGESPR